MFTGGNLSATMPPPAGRQKLREEKNQMKATEAKAAVSIVVATYSALTTPALTEVLIAVAARRSLR